MAIGRSGRSITRVLNLLRRRESAGERADTREDRLRANGARIGVNTRVYGTLDGVNPHLIEIGDHCVIGTQSALLAHCPIRGALPVRIGDYVWIGFSALVLPGVEIASRCIVGAGSVVTKNVPARSIVVGNPASVLRTLTNEEVDSLCSRLRSGEPIGKDATRRRLPERP